MNALEKIVDLLAAVSVLFLMPLLYYGSGRRVSQAVLAGQAGDTFLKRVSTAGEITWPVWEELGQALTKYGCEGFELQKERQLFEPTTEGGVVERVYIERTEKLSEEIQRDGYSRLCRGDRLRLTLYINDIPMVCYCCVRTGAEDF